MNANTHGLKATNLGIHFRVYLAFYLKKREKGETRSQTF